MKIFLLLLFLAARLVAADERAMLLVVSEPGSATYETEFRRQAGVWQELAGKAKMVVRTIGLGEVSPEGDRPQLEKVLAEIPKTGGDLWLVWIGHGSFDGRTANFNLRGTDIDAQSLKRLLEPIKRRLVILNLFSASAPFLPALAGPERVIVSAGRSGSERNHSRFGAKFADALTAPAADLDLDGSLSLLEATLHASAGTRSFYEDAQRVLQEHATLDDNGDGRPTPTDAFKGLRSDADGAVAREIFFLTNKPDPLPPEAREKRAALEISINALRKRKATLPEAEYYDGLEKLMREMAKLYAPTP